MTRKRTLALAVALTVTFIAAGSMAAELKIGNPAPDWSKLAGTDDKTHSLSDYKKAKMVVTVFTCNHCPVAIAYEDRLIELTEDYKGKGVQVIAVSVNDVKGDKLEGMKKRAADKEFNFPYLYDETQQIARDYGATCTPHVFVLCKQRKIAYMGAVDDNNNPDKAEKHYLRAAIDALLAGKAPPETKTQQRGCSIKWKKEEK